MSARAIRVAGRISLLVALTFPGCCGKQVSESAGWVAAAQASPAKMVGVFDAADGQTMRGWAWDPKQPDAPLKVDIYEGDELITTLVADQYRKDLGDIGLGNGKHGFEMVPPSKLSDGSAHAIHARFSGTAYDLNFSPRTFIGSEEDAGPPSPSPPGMRDNAARAAP
jgi:hypothetical protein